MTDDRLLDDRLQNQRLLQIFVHSKMKSFYAKNLFFLCFSDC